MKFGFEAQISGFDSQLKYRRGGCGTFDYLTELFNLCYSFLRITVKIISSPPFQQCVRSPNYLVTERSVDPSQFRLS